MAMMGDFQLEGKIIAGEAAVRAENLEFLEQEREERCSSSAINAGTV